MVAYFSHQLVKNYVNLSPIFGSSDQIYITFCDLNVHLSENSYFIDQELLIFIKSKIIATNFLILVNMVSDKSWCLLIWYYVNYSMLLSTYLMSISSNALSTFKRKYVMNWLAEPWYENMFRILIFKRINMWQVYKTIWQVDLQMWQDNVKLWQVNKIIVYKGWLKYVTIYHLYFLEINVIIWQVVAEIYMPPYSFSTHKNMSKALNLQSLW